MYNIIESGSHIILASFAGFTFVSAADWCERNGYRIVAQVNSRNYFVTRSN